MSEIEFVPSITPGQTPRASIYRVAHPRVTPRGSIHLVYKRTLRAPTLSPSLFSLHHLHLLLAALPPPLSYSSLPSPVLCMSAIWQHSLIFSLDLTHISLLEFRHSVHIYHGPLATDTRYAYISSIERSKPDACCQYTPHWRVNMPQPSTSPWSVFTCSSL